MGKEMVGGEFQVQNKNDWQTLPTPNVVHSVDGVVDVSNINLVIPVVNCTITDFTGGVAGQTIKVLGTGTTSTISGANITRRSADPLVADRIYIFTYIEYLSPGGTLKNKWIENI
jgi:hypothetical protein